LTFDAAAAPAATAEVLAAVALAGFDITPGGDDPAAQVFMLPFGFTATTFNYYAGWANTPDNALVGVFGPFPNRNRATLRSASMVTFTSAVPEPSAAVLALMGMGVVLWARRRKSAAPAGFEGTRP
jgi:PEP-CTERM motif